MTETTYVLIELDVDDRWEIPSIIACLRAGAAAIEQTPLATTDVTGALHVAAVVRIARETANDIVNAAEVIHDERVAANAAQRKAERKDRRAKERSK